MYENKLIPTHRHKVYPYKLPNNFYQLVLIQVYRLNDEWTVFHDGQWLMPIRRKNFFTMNTNTYILYNFLKIFKLMINFVAKI